MTMRTRVIPLVTAAVLATALLYRLDTSEAAGANHPEYRVASVSARLFYSETGGFSPNVVSKSKDMASWNGRATGGNTFVSTLVVVKIVGRPEMLLDRHVRLMATSEGKTLLDKKARVGILSDKGTAYLGFWIYDCPWRPLHLRAEIVGSPVKTAVRATIPFNGGE